MLKRSSDFNKIQRELFAKVSFSLKKRSEIYVKYHYSRDEIFAKSERIEDTMFGIRNTLRIGSLVFGLSSILLLLLPKKFLELLNLETSNNQLIWSMRMIGITLIALTGNMYINSKNSDLQRVQIVGWVMAICATGLGILTLAIPVKLNWFSVLYAIIGFTFGLNYLLNLILKKY